MSEAPYVPFYTSDFLAGTSGMTAATKGVYITLLCLMYEAEAPLPQSWETLSRRCGCTLPAFRKAIESLSDDAKISLTDAGLWSQKCDKHIAHRRERQSSAKAAAKKRWEKDKQKQSKPYAEASSAQCQPEPEPDIREDTDVSSLSSGDDFALQAPPLDEVSEAVAAYNATAERSGWPKVQKLTKARRSALMARLRDCGGIDGWRHALTRAQASPWCNGQNSRGWVCNFDFLTRQSSFAKLMEGNYDPRNSTSHGSRADRSNTGMVAAFAAVAARRSAAS